MKLRRLIKPLVWIYAGVALTILIVGFLSATSEQRHIERERRAELLRVQKLDELRSQIRQRLGPLFLQNSYPTELDGFADRKPSSKEKVAVRYTFDEEMQKEAQKLLRAYKPDFGAIVLMDAETGQVLALQNYEKAKDNPRNWAVTATFPAASVFKIVAATAAIDRHNLGPDTIVMFNGANHTLYRKNVLSTQINRWTREMTLKEAFGLSVNTFFGKLVLEKLQPADIEDYAIRFGFNKPIGSDLPFDTGFTEIPAEKNFHLAEIASGFNRITRMSPIQGAMIAASVAAQGVMKVPHVVESISRPSGEILFQAEPITAAVTMSHNGADRLKVLMEHTVTRGTSRNAFRPFLKDRRLKDIEVGGKTGSLMGDNPKGKTDWFVGYAIGEHRKLAVAAVTTHIDYWTVKSAHLAQEMFRKYFKQDTEASRLYSARSR